MALIWVDPDEPPLQPCPHADTPPRISDALLLSDPITQARELLRWHVELNRKLDAVLAILQSER